MVLRLEVDCSYRRIWFKFFRYLPLLLCVYIAVCYTVCGFYMPPLGDDLGYTANYINNDDCWYAFPRFIYRNWLFTNGRLADKLGPIGYVMVPLWIRALSNGLVTGLMFYMIARLGVGSLRNHISLSLLIISLVAFTFRWDSIWMEYSTQYNYVWSTTYILITLWVIFSVNLEIAGIFKWLFPVFCFIAGGMHEAAGVPVAIGLTIYELFSKDYKGRTRVWKLSVSFLILGAIFTLSSPASYHRYDLPSHRDSILNMMLTSGAYVVILLILILWKLIVKRVSWREMLASREGVWCIASLVSVVFMLYAGKGGRAGWFAQTYALIAIFSILKDSQIRIGRLTNIGIDVFLFLCLLFHFSELTIWQKKLGTEARWAIERYKASDDGIIFLDFIDDSQTPWYLLRKTHGVPDADDSYYLDRFRMHYGEGKRFIVLPEAAEKLDWQHFSGTLHLGNSVLTDRKLATYTDYVVDIYPRQIIRIAGIEMIEVPFSKSGRRLYYYTPVDRNPGEQ